MNKDELLKEAMEYVKAIWNNIDSDCKLRLGANRLMIEYRTLMEKEVYEKTENKPTSKN